MSSTEDFVKSNIRKITDNLPEGVRLVAVSKFNPPELVQAAYDEGQRLFGESHAQELMVKAAILPKDIQWHFIGHLQTNKVKQVVPVATCIESVDSLKLLKEIDKQAAKCGKTIKCLLQFHVAQEETKFGFTLDECVEMLKSPDFAAMQNIVVAGVMGMASITDDEAQILREFGTIADNFRTLKSDFFRNSADFKEISMGMTHDYPLAIQKGATLIRVGSGIFGERMYQ